MQTQNGKKMNIYNFLRHYMNERYLSKPKDFEIWKAWFKIQYLNACISYQAKAQSLGDNTVFAQRQIELTSDVAFQKEAWDHFLETVDKLDKENREFLLVHKHWKQGMCNHPILNHLVRSCVIPPLISIKRALEIINQKLGEPS